MTNARQNNETEQTISSDAIISSDEEKIVDDYKKLNAKCDVVISKIKNRKNKNKSS